MTTKPKAKKYRIRRSTPAEAPKTTPESKGAVSGEVTSAREMSVDQEIDAIRKEGLTGRQLRMARRVAQKYGLAPTSDFDAVRLLRAKGVDPFQRGNMLEVVPGGQAGAVQQANLGQLPQTMQPGQNNLPSTAVNTEANRAREILKIQRDIARRRRRKATLLLTRLAFFVFLPTLLVGFYYYAIATPMYATYSQFVIQKADAPSGGGGGGGLSGLLGGTGLATSQDSIAVQSYLQSREAMQRLDKDHGYKAHFSDSSVDPVQRLDPDATDEKAYKLYKRNVIIGYDPTEGIIKMEVIAADPEVSATYSNALISYAEEQVDHMTTRLRADQMKGADDSYENAEVEMGKAQQRVIDLQEQFKVISGDVEISLLTSQISALQQEQLKSELLLDELRANARPNPAKVKPLERKIATLKRKISTLRKELTEGGAAGGQSVARITSELAVAQANLETRNLMLQTALQQRETARIEANRQTRYLSLGVRPIVPDEAAYPRKFENTVLAMLIFSGIYLMMSLTASILREQVTS